MVVVLASPWIHPAVWCLKISVSSCRHRLQLHLHRRHRPPVSKHAMWHDDDDTLWNHQYGASPMTCTHREHITGLQKHWQPTLSPAGCAAILAVSRKHAMLEAASVPLLFSANWEMFGEELPVLTKHIYTHTYFSIVIMWAGDSDVGVTECVSPAKLLTLFSPQHLQTLGSRGSIRSFIINYSFQLCSFTGFKDIFQFALFHFRESVFLLWMVTQKLLFKQMTVSLQGYLIFMTTNCYNCRSFDSTVSSRSAANM